MANILASDIGATNSRFAFFELDSSGQINLQTSLSFPTAEVNSFSELLDMLETSKVPFASRSADAVVLAAAGPVERDGVYCDPPWIPWDIDLERDSARLPARSALIINDFVAQAYAVRTVVGEQARVVLEGDVPAAKGTIGVIGAGTNLGKAMLVPSAGGWLAVPSEGGHVSFPLGSAREFDFFAFAFEKLETSVLTLENVVSGKGISLVHSFLYGEDKQPEDITSAFDSYPETLEWCSMFYARACRDFALDVLAIGGLYIAGGVAAKSPELVQTAAFKDEFLRSPRHADLLGSITLRLMEDEQSGLWGAAFCGSQLLTS